MVNVNHTKLSYTTGGEDMQIDLKRRILTLHAAGKTPEWIARKLGLPQMNVNYYLRTYASGTKYHIKYDLDVLESLHSAQTHGTLDALCATYGVSRQGALNLIAKYRKLEHRRQEIQETGWFNPAKAYDCWAVGLPFHHVAEQRKALAKIKLRIALDDGAAWLEAVIPHQRRRFKLSLEDEINLLQNGIKWVEKQAARIRDNWVRVKRQQRRTDHE